jgi:hypothetical protein
MSNPIQQIPLEVWTFVSGAVETRRGLTIPNKGTIPLSVQVQTITAPANITVTQSAADATVMVLSSSDYEPESIKEGDYFYNAQGVGLKRKIIKVWPGSFKVDYAFPTTITAQDLLIASRAPYRFLRVEVSGTVDTGDFDGYPMKVAAFPIQIDFPEVVTYDASTASEGFKFTIGI